MLPNNSPRFNNLDIVRFVVSFVLIFFHAYTGWSENFGPPPFVLNDAGSNFSPTGKILERIIHNLVFGGEIFLLISGFIITLTLLREQDKSGDIYIRGFYMRRLLRIMPLYLIALLLSPLLVSLLNEHQPNYWSWIFMYGNLDQAYNGWGPMATNHLWYINIEMQFYLLIPIVLVIIRKKYLPLFFSALIFLSFLFRTYSFHSPMPWNMIYLHTFSRMDALAIGCWFGLIYFQRNEFRVQTPLLMRLMLYFVFIYIMITDEYTNYANIFFATVKKYTYLALCGFILANYVFNPRARLSPKKENILHRLGRASFGIYIFSNMVIVAMIYVCKITPVLKNFWLYFGIINIIAIVLSLLSYKFMELPVNNLRRFFARTTTTQKPEQVSK